MVVLIALAYAYQGPLRKWQNSLGAPVNFLAGIDTAKIDKIELTQNGKSYEYDKNGDNWFEAGSKKFPLTEGKVQSFLDEFKKVQNSAIILVSANKNKKSDFQTDNSGVEVKLSGNNVSIDFVSGKLGSDFISTYVSKSDSNETYSVKGALASYLENPDWRDPTIFSSDETNITKIRFQYPGRQFTIEKKNNKWVGSSGLILNANKVNAVLSEMSVLYAAEIPDQTFAGTGLEKHSIIVEAGGKGIDNVIMIGDKNKEGLYYAKTGKSDNIYLITQKDRDALNKKVADLE